MSLDNRPGIRKVIEENEQIEQIEYTEQVENGNPVLTYLIIGVITFVFTLFILYNFFYDFFLNILY